MAAVDRPDEASSWAGRKTRSDLGACLFSFAVIADTHVDLEDGPSSSPFPVNALTNKRTRFCIDEIVGLADELGPLAPRFVLHLGDLIHPVPSMPAYAAAADDFKEIVSRLAVPLYLLPGNHDVGDKPVEWAPAGVVRDGYLKLWEAHFGAHYQSFDVDNCHFILLNAQVINSGLALEAQQKAWLEQDLADHAGRRNFLALHYPPYLMQPLEVENYDNLGEPGRSWLLSLLTRYKPEALFAGHVHHYWYNRFSETDCYLLPSTSFTRQDFSEMFRVAPTAAMQDGRDDQAKVGYFVVVVYEHGHVCHIRRTQGEMLARGEPARLRARRVATCHTREIDAQGLGFDLRHPWAEATEIAPSGALDEFHRKTVRNDYPALALWDMAVRNLRIPLHDLSSPELRDRIRAMVLMGNRFTVISQGAPDRAEQQLLVENKHLISRWEIALSAHRIANALPALHAVKAATSFPIVMASLRSKADVVKSGEPYFHRITYGFVPADAAEITSLVSNADIGSVFSGFAFRVGRDAKPWAQIAEIDELATSLGIAATVTVFMADRNPALHQCDDLANSNRLAEALAAAAVHPRLDVFSDTFMDLDRGHSVRHGVIDRLCNPRMGYHVTQALHAVISGMTLPLEAVGSGAGPGAAWVAWRGGDASHMLMLPSLPQEEVLVPARVHGGREPGSVRVIDLASGAVHERECRAASDGIVASLGEAMRVPLLLSFRAPASQSV